MAKGAYFGVGSTAKKIKKMYIGIGGIARKVKRAYIGIADKARLWFSGEPSIIRDPSVTLSEKRMWFGGGPVGNYAVFAGGQFGSTADSFNSSLTRRVLQFRKAVYLPAMSIGGTAVSKQKYILFPGGQVDRREYTDMVTGYNDSLVSVTAASLPYKLYEMGAGNLYGNGFCAGGLTGTSASTGRTEAYMYTQSLTISNIDSLDYKRWGTRCASVGVNSASGHIIFAGGVSTDGNDYNQTRSDVYDAYGTRKSAINLRNRWTPGVASSDKYAVIGFGAGFRNGWQYPRKDVVFCDKSLTQHTVETNEPRAQICGGYLNGLYFFSGGSSESSSHPSSTHIFVFDENMTMLNYNNFYATKAVNDPQSAVAGDKLIFAGGNESAENSASITVIEA